MRELGTLAAPVVSALPGTGATGQLVSFGGSIYQFSGSAWVALGGGSGGTTDLDAQTLYWMGG